MLKTEALLALAATVLVACGESTHPFSPASTEPAPTDAPAPLDRTADAGAVVEEGTGVFTFDGVFFFDCVGEDIRSVVYAPYTYHLVQMPNGDFLYQETWDTEAVTGTLTGQTSGIVWQRTNNVSPLIQRSTGGGMLHYTFKGDFESELGPDLKVHEIFHASWNAGGELTAEQYHFNCRVAKN